MPIANFVILRISIALLPLILACCVGAVSFTYVGCYGDLSNGRDLTGLAGRGTVSNYSVHSSGSVRSDLMTLEFCSRICSFDKFPYFGVQYGIECYCGNEYGKPGPRDEADCQRKTCPGNPAQHCGGGSRNGVYWQIYYPKTCSCFQQSPKVLDSTLPSSAVCSVPAETLLSCLMLCTSDCLSFLYSPSQSQCKLISADKMPTPNVTAQPSDEFFVCKN